MTKQQEPEKLSPYRGTFIKQLFALKGYCKKKKSREMHYCTRYISVDGTGHLMVTH